MQPIRVEKSLAKPKFGFNAELETQATYTNEDRCMKIGDLSSVKINSVDYSESISIPISQPDSSVEMKQVPSNFGELLKYSPETVKRNTYDNKIK